jgi:uncharacterized protein YcbK (DUF882 family)
MGDVSKHFNRSEFACNCPDNCGFSAVDVDLLSVLESVREKFGPVIMHCACRCLKYNRELGSKDTSQHVKGLAADFHINGVEPEKMAYWLNERYPNSLGIGIYKWGVHVDVRKKRARWNKIHG